MAIGRTRAMLSRSRFEASVREIARDENSSGKYRIDKSTSSRRKRDLMRAGLENQRERERERERSRLSTALINIIIIVLVM